MDFPLRLDLYLKIAGFAWSRSQALSLIQAGRVFIDGRLAGKPSLIVQKSNVVTVSPDSSSSGNKDNSFIEEPSNKDFFSDPVWADLAIVSDEPEFIVFSKPAGIIVHSTAKSEDSLCLSSWLSSHLQKVNTVELFRAGVVHRLDKETSGVLLVAKTLTAQAKLSALFQGRKITKTYLSILTGHTPIFQTISFSIGRDASRRERWTINGIGAKPAVSHLSTRAWLCLNPKTLESIFIRPDDLCRSVDLSANKITCPRDGCSQARVDSGEFVHLSFVQFGIETGRTHQIRVHSRAIGHPVLGDGLYGKRSPLIGRHALHAARLSFELDGNLFDYSAPLPADMKKLLPTVLIN